MTVKEKLERHMRGRKGGVTTKELSNYFLVGRTAVNSAMRALVNEGKIISEKTSPNNQNVWKWNYRRVAVSKDVDSVQPSDPTPNKPPVIGPTSTWTTSYPHVRGYDD